jgi:hypothetical protein
MVLHAWKACGLSFTFMRNDAMHQLYHLALDRGEKAESFSSWVSNKNSFGRQSGAHIMLLHAWKACGLSFTLIGMLPCIKFGIWHWTRGEKAESFSFWVNNNTAFDGKVRPTSWCYMHGKPVVLPSLS